MRRVGWFSCGAASAIACALAEPDVVAYCETGSEHDDNERFLRDCERVFGWSVRRLRSEKYADTYDVWESRRYMSGIAGAPCTSELKVKPRLAFQRPGDVHIFGYTAEERSRADALTGNWPDLQCEFPLIERSLGKAACLAMVEDLGIALPVTYAMGFRNANCLKSGCVKATSPDYWSNYRHHFPANFDRTARLSRSLGVQLTRLDGRRAYIDEIPADWPRSEPTAPACDMLCQLAETDLIAKA